MFYQFCLFLLVFACFMLVFVWFCLVFAVFEFGHMCFIYCFSVTGGNRGPEGIGGGGRGYRDKRITLYCLYTNEKRPFNRHLLLIGTPPKKEYKGI